jgi:hypothetical protein
VPVAANASGQKLPSRRRRRRSIPGARARRSPGATLPRPGAAADAGPPTFCHRHKVLAQPRQFPPAGVVSGRVIFHVTECHRPPIPRAYNLPPFRARATNPQRPGPHQKGHCARFQKVTHVFKHQRRFLKPAIVVPPSSSWPGPWSACA